jgi:hypothetical protein
MCSVPKFKLFHQLNTPLHSKYCTLLGWLELPPPPPPPPNEAQVVCMGIPCSNIDPTRFLVPRWASSYPKRIHLHCSATASIIGISANSSWYHKRNMYLQRILRRVHPSTHPCSFPSINLTHAKNPRHRTPSHMQASQASHQGIRGYQG